MKKIEYLINLEVAKNEQDVFKVFSNELRFFTWTITNWSGFDDLLWSFIQGPNLETIDNKDIEAVQIKVVNSKHLNSVSASLIKDEEVSVFAALESSFEHIIRNQKSRVQADDLSVFRNSTLEIVS